MKKYSITDEKEQTIVKHLFDACNKEMSQEEFEVVQMINKLRTEPAAFVKEFIQYAKLMKKEDKSEATADMRMMDMTPMPALEPIFKILRLSKRRYCCRNHIMSIRTIDDM